MEEVKMFLEPEPKQGRLRNYVNYTPRHINGKNYVELKNIADGSSRNNVSAFLNDISVRRTDNAYLPQDPNYKKNIDFYTYIRGVLTPLGKFNGISGRDYEFQLNEDSDRKEFPPEYFNTLLYEDSTTGGRRKRRTNRKKSKRRKTKRRKSSRRR